MVCIAPPPSYPVFTLTPEVPVYICLSSTLTIAVGSPFCSNIGVQLFSDFNTKFSQPYSNRILEFLLSIVNIPPLSVVPIFRSGKLSIALLPYIEC